MLLSLGKSNPPSTQNYFMLLAYRAYLYDVHCADCTPDRWTTWKLEGVADENVAVIGNETREYWINSTKLCTAKSFDFFILLYVRHLMHFCCSTECSTPLAVYAFRIKFKGCFPAKVQLLWCLLSLLSRRYRRWWQWRSSTPYRNDFPHLIWNTKEFRLINLPCNFLSAKPESIIKFNKSNRNV